MSLSGLPPHKLTHEMGTTVILLQNMNPRIGSMKLIVKRLYNNTINSEVITGEATGKFVILPPRVILH